MAISSFRSRKSHRKGWVDVFVWQVKYIKKFEHAYSKRGAMLKQIFKCDFTSQPFILAEEMPLVCWPWWRMRHDSLFLLVTTFVANSQFMSSFSSAGSNYLTATCISHATSESVLVSSFSITRLICPFHFLFVFREGKFSNNPDTVKGLGISFF